MSDLLDDDIEHDEDDKSKILSIEDDGDGGLNISFGDDPQDDEFDDEPSDFEENLAASIDFLELNRIGEELLEGIERDDESRAEWLQQRVYGLDLLGLDPRRKGSAGGDVETSSIQHPLLLEAVLRFQANARGELLPVDGPAKVRDDELMEPDSGVPGPVFGVPNGGDLAEALETELNHYLTATATEYYPDTDRMLFWVGFGGTGFKKLYHCPLRNRPVSEYVDAKDIIVQNSPVDLANAGRITHSIKMLDTTLRRMQLVGAYIDTPIGISDDSDVNSVDQKVSAIQGKSETSLDADDRERTIYECYCDLDIRGHEHLDDDNQPSGIALPYKVTIDKSSRTVLEIRRNWTEDDQQKAKTPFPVAKKVFVKYDFVPGLGFYGIGLLHILGHATRAATAAWRIMIDAGMRANFGGGLAAKQAGRQNSIQMSGRPGEFVPIETGSKPLSDVVMPFPFKGPDQATMALVQDIVTTAQRVGGTAESNVGEGRQDAPVGTTLALLEAQKVILDAVHKRMHTAQAEELQILVRLFREDPEALWRSNPKPTLPWTRDLLIQAIDDHDIVPQADPNTSSHLQRLGQVQALQQMASAAPGLFDVVEVQKRILKMMRLPNYRQLLSRNPSIAPQPNPDKQAEIQLKLQIEQGRQALAAQKQQADQVIAALKHQLQMFEAQTKRASVVGKLKVDGDRNHIAATEAMRPESSAPPDPNAGLAAHVAIMDAETRRMDAVTRKQGLLVKHADTVVDAHNQAADRASENQIAALNAHKELAMHAATLRDNEVARQAEAEANRLANGKGDE